jgi:hypothetical protein
MWLAEKPLPPSTFDSDMDRAQVDSYEQAARACDQVPPRHVYHIYRFLHADVSVERVCASLVQEKAPINIWSTDRDGPAGGLHNVP